MSGVPSLPAYPASVDLIGYWARVTPSRVALIEERTGREITYDALDRLVARWGRRLATRGIGAGARVALLAGTHAACVALFYACVRRGAALVPLNWRLAPPELARIVDDARPTLLIADDAHAALAERAVAIAATPPIVARLDTIADEDDAVPPPIDVRADPDAPTMILYTSGSTGAPKGVVLPHRQLLHNAIATTVGWRLGADDVAPVPTPLFHTGGWHVFLTPLLHVGGTIVLCDGFDASRFLDALDTYGCTIAFAVPTQFAMLLDAPRWGRPLPRLRTFLSGGAPCPATLRDAVRRAGYRIRQGYGLTECGPNCFATSDEAAETHPDAVGWPMPFLEMRVARDDGADAAPGEPGELLLRGPQMFGGYHDAPERTAEVLTADGWLRTGDLARRDEAGRYTICGRRKEMFISGGENVFPGEVEAVLCELPGVAEVAVIGMPDEKWGEVGHAFVVVRAGCALTAESLLAGARTRLAGYKIPKRVVVRDALPRLGSGKVDRAALARDASHASTETRR